MMILMNLYSATHVALFITYICIVLETFLQQYDDGADGFHGTVKTLLFNLYPSCITSGSIYLLKASHGSVQQSHVQIFALEIDYLDVWKPSFFTIDANS